MEELFEGLAFNLRNVQSVQRVEKCDLMVIITVVTVGKKTTIKNKKSELNRIKMIGIVL